MTYYLNINSVFVLATLFPTLWLILWAKSLTPLAAKNTMYLAGIFLDLSKAFDTLDHAMLVSKLEACGITGTANQWITDHFRDRIQFVQIDDSKWDALRKICGVPQGSILGPLFFIIYINDLPACSNELEFISLDDETVTWMYLPPILTTTSTMFQLG